MLKEIAISALALMLTSSNINNNLVNNFTSEYNLKSSQETTSLKQKEEEITNPMELISEKEFVIEMFIPASKSELAHYERYKTKIEPVIETSKFFQDYKEIFKEKGIEEDKIFAIHQLKPSYSSWIDWTAVNYNKEGNFNAHFVVLNGIDEEKKTISFTEYDVFDDPSGNTYGENKGPLDIAIKTEITLDYSDFEDLNDIDCFKINKKDSFDTETSSVAILRLPSCINYATIFFLVPVIHS